MEISEVRVRSIDDPNARLKAFCSVTLDDVFVIRDLRIVDGTNGVFVAMPSRRVMTPCAKCGQKNHLRARYCNECGAKLVMPPIPKDADGNQKLHRDVAHPISAEFREVIQQRVLEAYHAEATKEEVERPPATESKPRDKKQATSRSEPEPDALSEYDSLIAGLGTGGEKWEEHGDRPHQRAARKAASTKPRSDAARGDTEDGPRRGGRRRAEDVSSKPATQAVNAAPTPGRAPEKKVSEPDSTSAETVSGFGVGVLEQVPDESTSRKRGDGARRDKAGSAPAAETDKVEDKTRVAAQEKKPADQQKIDGECVPTDAAEKKLPGSDEETRDDATAFGAGLG